MPVKSDKWIREMALEKGMIEPFQASSVRKGVSFGLSSYGYDFRVASHFKLLRPKKGDVLDCKNFDQLKFEAIEQAYLDIPPGGYCLGRSVEYFRIPRNILAICFGKSTYARSGISIYVTPLEPEWEGTITIAIMNHGPIPARVYAGEGIGQAIFLESDEICVRSYADKKGKYQAQREITGAKV